MSDIECINYRFIDKDADDSPIRIGVSAQSLVGKFDEVIDVLDDGYYGVRYSDMIPYLIKAVQELKEKVKILESKQ